MWSSKPWPSGLKGRWQHTTVAVHCYICPGCGTTQIDTSVQAFQDCFQRRKSVGDVFGVPGGPPLTGDLWVAWFTWCSFLDWPLSDMRGRAFGWAARWVYTTRLLGVGFCGHGSVWDPGMNCGLTIPCGLGNVWRPGYCIRAGCSMGTWGPFGGWVSCFVGLYWMRPDQSLRVHQGAGTWKRPLTWKS